jgi:hypothetical protein
MRESESVIKISRFKHLRQLLWRGRLVILAAVLLSGALSIWYAAWVGPEYETRAILSLKQNSVIRNTPLQLGRNAGLISEPAGKLEFLRRSILSDEVLTRVAEDRNLRAGLYRAREGGPPPAGRIVDDLRNRIVKVQVNIPNELLIVSVQVPDSAVAPKLVVALVQELEEKIRREVRVEAFANAELLGARLKVSDDPLRNGKLLKRAAVERERGLLVSSALLDVLSRPVVPQYRIKPNRKQLFALAVLLGAFLACCALVFRDEGVRASIVRSLERPPEGPDLASSRMPFAFLQHLAAMALLFCLVYNVSFLLLPSATTGRIAIVLLMGWGLKRNLDSIRNLVTANPVIFTVFGFILLYAFVVYRLNPLANSDIFSRVFHFLFYSVIGSVAYLNLIGRNWRRFHLHFMIIVAVQSALHIYSFFSFDYREWVSGVLVQGGNFDLTLGSRPPGFVNSAGAAFSVVQALGLFSALLVLRQSRTAWLSLVSGLLGVGIFVSAMLAGRTGMLISLLLLVFTVLTGSSRTRTAAVMIVVVSVIGALLFKQEIRFFLFLIDPVFERDFNTVIANAFELFYKQGKVGSAVHVYNMEIPPLGVETILGTGLVRVLVGEGHDSGYVQTYYSLGLVVAFAFYATLLSLLTKYFLRLPGYRMLMVLLVCLMFIVETKEPFIFKYALPFYVLTCFRLLVPDNPELVKTP